MSPPLTDHTLDQQRVAANLAEVYSAWREAARATKGDRWRWRPVNGTDYLYQLFHGLNNGKSLGPRSEDTEALFTQMGNLETRAKTGAKRMLLLGRMYKAARLPMVAPFAGAVLRELDMHGLLGDQLLVVGTNALVAYEIEAAKSVNADLHATEDFDLTWVGDKISPPVALLDIFKKADVSWTVSMERTFQVVNNHNEVIDILIAPSLLKNYPVNEKIKAMDIAGQEDLLEGTRIEQVVTDLRGDACRIIAPDPRRYAIHKWLLAQEPTRKAVKRHKDAGQAEAVLDLVRQGMPHLPLDRAFVKSLSPRLAAAWTQWQNSPAERARPRPR